MAIIMIRTFIIFFALIIFMRLLGKRQMREMELSEFVVSVLMADLAATPLQDIGIPLINGLIPITVLFACELIISGLGLSSVRFREMIYGKPSFLIIDGEIQEKEMRSSRYSLDELMEELRGKEILDISSVKYAVLETDGSLSTFLYPEEKPLSAKQFGCIREACPYPAVIIEDGHVLHDNLRRIGRNLGWLSKRLHEKGADDWDDVFIMIFYSEDNIYLLLKEKDNA